MVAPLACSNFVTVCLSSSVTPSGGAETLEWGYCRAYALTVEGYRLRRQGKKAECRHALTAALAEVERHLPAARAASHAALLQLYGTLDDDLGGDA